MKLSTRRESILAVVFAVVVAVVAVWETVGQTLIQPLRDVDETIIALSGEKKRLEQEAAAIERAMQNLKEFAGKSLPAEVGAASVAYQGWLIKLLEQNAVRSAIVTPAPAIVDAAVGHRIPFSVQCTASTKDIAGFLDQFYATPLLHRITNLSLSGTADGAAHHRVVISIEALSFGAAAADSSLPSPGAVPDNDSLASLLARENIFCRRHPEKPRVAALIPKAEPVQQKKIAPARTEPVKPDPRKSIRFVASVWNGKEREAWFIDQRSRGEASVVARSSLRFPDIECMVHFVDDDVLVLEFGGKRGRLLLGQTLQELSELQ